jgi:hypothetical protein
MDREQQSYYLTNKKKIMKDFDRLITVARTTAKTRLDPELIDALVEKVYSEYENLLPQLPYVGDEKSPFTRLNLDSAATVAFYKACKESGMEPREIGQWMYEVGEAYVNSMSGIKKRLARRMVFSESYKRKWKKRMTESQTREYPENWVGQYVEGDGKTFEYGLDFTECGCLKLFRKLGCEEIAPYACLNDFARMRGLNVGFRRTQVLSRGHPKCDFRFVKDYKTPRGWPPESLEESKHGATKHH